MESPLGSSWYPEMQFAQFKNNVMGSILSYNKELLDQIQDWNDMLLGDVLQAYPYGKMENVTDMMKSATFFRITSYNVCYTKLLRSTPGKR